VDLQTHPVPETVGELLAVARGGDAGARHGVQRDQLGAGDHSGAGLPLSLGHQLVDLSLPLLRLSRYDDGAGAVGVVAGVAGTEVDLEQVPRRDRTISRRMVRYRRVGAGRDDGVEADRLRPARKHPRLQVAGDLPLGTPLQRSGEDPLQR
jgi:hypothetical protein